MATTKKISPQKEKKNQIVEKAIPAVSNVIAVIATGGKQYLVKVGDVVKVEKLNDEKKQIELNDILHGRKVVAEIIKQEKDKKIHGVKFKKRKDYLKFYGHRQIKSYLKILKIK